VNVVECKERPLVGMHLSVDLAKGLLFDPNSWPQAQLERVAMLFDRSSSSQASWEKVEKNIDPLFPLEPALFPPLLLLERCVGASGGEQRGRGRLNRIILLYGS